MSEERDAFYTRESHPHSGDPRVDPQARRGGYVIGTEVLETPPISQDVEEVSSGVEQVVAPTIRIEQLKSKKKQRIIINEGTRDQIVQVGRVYGLREGIIIRSAPAERRDSHIAYESKPGDGFFKVDGRDASENGVAYFNGFVFHNNGIGVLPSFIAKGVVRKDSFGKK